MSLGILKVCVGWGDVILLLDGMHLVCFG
jgi:hypothetical protein